jgi:hypothetical protein
MSGSGNDKSLNSHHPLGDGEIPPDEHLDDGYRQLKRQLSIGHDNYLKSSSLQRNEGKTTPASNTNLSATNTSVPLSKQRVYATSLANKVADATNDNTHHHHTVHQDEMVRRDDP